MADSVAARPVLSEPKLRHGGDVRPVLSRSCGSEGGRPEAAHAGYWACAASTIARWVSAARCARCRPPCVCESTGAGVRRCPTHMWAVRLLVAGHEATLLAARLVRTLSAAHFVRGVERPRDLGSPVRVVLPLRAVFNLES